jgi:PhnB protein
MHVQSYLFFEGRCEEALAFYGQALGAVTDAVMRYGDSPDPMPDGMLPPGSEHKVMHAQFRIGETTLLTSDGNCSGKARPEGFGQALSVEGESEARHAFAALGDGGTVVMPMGKTFFSPAFGMVKDRFGILWMVMTAA